MNYLDQLSKIYHRGLYLNSKASLPKEMKSFLKLNLLDQMIMNIIFEKHSCSINELNKILKRSKSTMTSAIKRLEKMELIRREQSLIDKRVFNISLTQEGIRLQNMHHQFENMIFTKILSVFKNDEEIDVFLELLERVLKEFENDYEVE